MATAERVLHLIDRLDGYGSSRWLATVVSEPISAEPPPEVVTFSLPRLPADEWPQTASLRVLHARSSPDLIAWGRLACRLRRRDYDCLHVWDAPSLRRAIRFAPRRVGLIASCSVPSRYAETTLSRADCVAISHEGLRAGFAARGVREDRLHVVPPSTPRTAPVLLSRAEAWQRLQLAETTRVVAAAGPLTRPSQFDEAIWRLELVRVLYPEVRLVIVGDGPDRHRLERYVRLVSDPDVVRIIPRGELGRAALAHADVYWQTSCTGDTPPELVAAMSRGAAIVATDVPAHRAVLADRLTGMLAGHDSRADFARCTDALFGDPAQAKQLGLAAEEAAGANHPPRRMTEGYRALYAGLRCRAAEPRGRRQLSRVG